MIATLEPTVMNFTYAPNDTVLGRYTIRRGIGMGGFGEVYFAHSQAGKEVALKRIQRNLAVELRGVSHCLNLKHPNLVSLHDICRDDEDQAWVVMEYVAGKNLREVLDDADPSTRICTMTASGAVALPSGLSIEEVRRWFCGMAAGTAHLHAAGLVHRDLKPGNLFDDNGIIKVGDYGLSKFISLSHRSAHTESIGTLHYMAPEIGRGQYGREIDLYACGIILFEMLTGSLPFDGETPQEIIVKHLTDRPDLSNVPVDFRNMIAACLQKNPASRPSDVAAMMALTPWANDYHAPAVWPSPAPVSAAPTHAPEMRDGVESAAMDAAPPHVMRRPPSDEEPIARALGGAVSGARLWWRNLECSPVAKALIALSVGVILTFNLRAVLPLLTLVAFVYIPYFVIRQIVMHARRSDAAAPRPSKQYYTEKSYSKYDGYSVAAAAVPPPRLPMRLSKSQARKLLRQSLAQRPRISLAAEWATSSVISVLVAAALLAISIVMGLRHSAMSPIAVAPYVWMACVVWLGSVGLLALGKAWESSDGEGLPRRLTAACLGASIGVAAYLLASALMVPLDQGLGREIDATELPSTFYHASGVPTVAAMMAHFAMLFALLRLWKPVDPLRRRRLSLWAIAVAVVGEWIVQQVIPIPQPAGMLIAGGIVLMSQIAAPWVKSDSISAHIST